MELTEKQELTPEELEELKKLEADFRGNSPRDTLGMMRKLKEAETVIPELKRLRAQTKRPPGSLSAQDLESGKDAHVYEPADDVKRADHAVLKQSRENAERARQVKGGKK